MNSNQKAILALKKEQIKNQIKCNYFLKNQLTALDEITPILKQLTINYGINSFRCVAKECTESLIKGLQKANQYHNNLIITTQDAIVDAILKTFPNTHPSRYIPDFPIESLDILKTKISRITAEENILLCWLHYSFVLEIGFKDILALLDSEIITTWHGDLLVVPESKKWLISYSIEEEWRTSLPLC